MSCLSLIQIDLLVKSKWENNEKILWNHIEIIKQKNNNEPFFKKKTKKEERRDYVTFYIQEAEITLEINIPKHLKYLKEFFSFKSYQYNFSLTLVESYWLLET